MTEGSRKKVDELKKEYGEAAKQMYLSDIPAKVMEVFKTHSEYFETTTNLYLDGHGFNRDSVDFVGSLPSMKSYSCPLKLTAARGETLVKMKRKYVAAKQAYKDLVDETETALLTLRTFARIRETLPEAAPFLPPPMSNSLVVNFDTLQKKLKAQPEVPENARLKKQYAAVVATK